MHYGEGSIRAMQLCIARDALFQPRTPTYSSLYHALIIINELSYSLYMQSFHLVLFPPSPFDFFGLEVAIGIAPGWSFILFCICINEVPLVLKYIFRLLHYIPQACVPRIDEVERL
jgi:hypothetical protein